MNKIYLNHVCVPFSVPVSTNPEVSAIKSFLATSSGGSNGSTSDGSTTESPRAQLSTTSPPRHPGVSGTAQTTAPGHQGDMKGRTSSMGNHHHKPVPGGHYQQQQEQDRPRSQSMGSNWRLKRALAQVNSI